MGTGTLRVGQPEPPHPKVHFRWGIRSSLGTARFGGWGILLSLWPGRGRGRERLRGGFPEPPHPKELARVLRRVEMVHG